MDAIENKNLSNLNDNLPNDLLNKLKLEANMQISALERINIWKNIAIAVSTLGVALAYAGFAGAHLNIFFGVLGYLPILPLYPISHTILLSNPESA